VLLVPLVARSRGFGVWFIASFRWRDGDPLRSLLMYFVYEDLHKFGSKHFLL
jgi:hypothetical protein